MVQSYSLGVGNVSSHEGMLAPPGEYDWTCASSGPLESITEMANGSVQPFAQLTAEVPILYNESPYPPKLPFPTGDLDLPCNTMLWAHVRSQPKRHFDRFSRACTDDCRVSLYGLPVSPSKLFLPMLASGPVHGSLGPPESGTQMATWSFQPFLQGSLVWQTDRATDRPTDHATRCDAA